MVWKRVLARPAQLLAALLAVVLVVAVALIGGIAWRDLRRVERIRLHVSHTARIQHLSLHLQETLVTSLTRDSTVERQVLADLRREVTEIRDLDFHLDPHTGGRLDRVRALLEQDFPIPRHAMVAALALVRELVVDENRAQADLLSKVSDDARGELAIVIAILVALPVLGLFAYGNLRQRIVKPLDDLRELLAQLASGEFKAIHPEHLHAMLVPLFTNYNHLVTRLKQLEEQHRSRAQSLEGEVRNATQALLEQQRTLARAERLAAAGEMAAGLAHELRNPLAGVLMSLGNLRRDVHDPDLVERVDLAIGEIERLTRLLNEYLSSARHAPEAPRPVNLRTLVGDLLSLLRYQVPDRVILDCTIADDLDCTLPRDRVRQAILNLVLNSVQALGESPGRVTVAAHRDDRRLTLSVSDDGPGFSSDHLAGGVHPFATRRDSGTGLGLAMVRRVALDLGGELYLENSEPRGACARLVLPCSRG